MRRVDVSFPSYRSGFVKSVWKEKQIKGITALDQIARFSIRIPQNTVIPTTANIKPILRQPTLMFQDTEIVDFDIMGIDEIIGVAL